MYLKKLRLKNIKCFEDVTLEFPHTDGDYSGWIVLLGENATGKTAILQAIAFLLQGRQEYGRSPLNVGSWSRSGEEGRFDAYFLYSSEEAEVVEQEFRRSGGHRYLNTGQLTHYEAHFAEKPHVAASNGQKNGKQRKVLACGYGAHRRLTFEDYSETLAFADARFLTLFFPHTGLAGPLDWLPKLYGASLDPKNSNRKRAGTWLEHLRQVLNQLLPVDVQIADVTTDAVLFHSRNGEARGDDRILSEGYRSFLALSGSLLEHLWATNSEIEPLIRSTDDGIQILAEGIVLIDEADAHLHPSWQRELGERLRKVFPKIQFIVTTHSPFIAQEATEGGLFVLRRNEKGTVEVEKFAESVRGWSATQILTSPLFGLDSTRSVETDNLIRRNSELLAKERADKLTAAEKKEFKRIKETLETQLSAPGETYDEMNRQEEMRNYVEETLKGLKNGKS